jgi:hypothetical protein
LIKLGAAPANFSATFVGAHVKESVIVALANRAKVSRFFCTRKFRMQNHESFEITKLSYANFRDRFAGDLGPFGHWSLVTGHWSSPRSGGRRGAHGHSK